LFVFPQATLKRTGILSVHEFDGVTDLRLFCLLFTRQTTAVIDAATRINPPPPITMICQVCGNVLPEVGVADSEVDVELDNAEVVVAPVVAGPAVTPVAAAPVVPAVVAPVVPRVVATPVVADIVLGPVVPDIVLSPVVPV
jgi:hypothetical protein